MGARQSRIREYRVRQNPEMLYLRALKARRRSGSRVQEELDLKMCATLHPELMLTSFGFLRANVRGSKVEAGECASLPPGETALSRTCGSATCAEHRVQSVNAAEWRDVRPHWFD